MGPSRHRSLKPRGLSPCRCRGKAIRQLFKDQGVSYTPVSYTPVSYTPVSYTPTNPKTYKYPSPSHPWRCRGKANGQVFEDTLQRGKVS